MTSLEHWASNRRVAGLVGMIVPAAAVATIKLCGFGAASSQAEPLAPTPAVAVSTAGVDANAKAAKPVVFGPATQAARAYLQSRAAGNEPDWTTKPAFYASPAVSATPSLPDLPVNPADLERVPDFLLTGVMDGRTPMAVINGRLLRVGEMVAPGWALNAIDPATLTVTLMGPDETAITLEANRPCAQSGKTLAEVRAAGGVQPSDP